MGSVLVSIGVRLIAWVIFEPVTLIDSVKDMIARMDDVKIDKKAAVLKSTRMARERLGERHTNQRPFKGDATGQPVRNEEHTVSGGDDGCAKFRERRGRRHSQGHGKGSS